MATINDQLDSAIRFYADTSLVELVLVSGCGNDVGVQNFLNALNSGEVDNMTRFKRLKSNSLQWHQASNTQLAQAVSRVNAEMDRPHVAFVKIDFPAAYSFAAPKTWLWGFNRSPFRMALLFLSFGKVLLPSNDEVRKQRSASCSEVYKEQPNETIEQRKDRKALRFLCRYAALGHPNRKGALLYANAITKTLSSTMLVTASNTP